MNKQTQKDLLNIVKTNYEEISDQFNETRKKHLWPELVEISQQIKDDSKILDVGCGNGRLLDALKYKKINYLGVDTSEKLIILAKEKYPEYKFSLGDILQLGNIPDINYDFVFCIAVLQHIPGKNLQIDALKQMRNKISDNGRIIISVWNLWNQPKYSKIIYKFILLKLIGKNKMDIGDILFDWKNTQGDRVSKRYYHAFRKQELKRIIYKSGLKIEKIYKDDYNLYTILKK